LILGFAFATRALAARRLVLAPALHYGFASFARREKRVEEAMSIQKKSLISTLKTAKKANVASEVKSEKMASMRMAKQLSAKTLKSLRSANLKSAKAASPRVAF